MTSPPIFYHSVGSSTGAATPPILTRVDAEESGVYNSYSNKPTSIHVQSEMNNVSYRSSGVSPRLSGRGNSPIDRESAGNISPTGPSLRTSAGDSAYTSKRVTEIDITDSEVIETLELSRKDSPAHKPQPPVSPVAVASPSAETTNQQSMNVNRQTTSSTASLTPSHHAKFCPEEPKAKYRWSPRMGDQVHFIFYHIIILLYQFFLYYDLYKYISLY